MEYRFEVRDIPEQKVLYIAETVPQDGLGDAFMRILPEAYGYAVSNGAQPAGPPFGRYVGWRETDCDLEAGIVISTDVPETTQIKLGSLGGFKAVVTQHIGPYDYLPKAHGACNRWILENGMEMAGAPCEIYTMDPGTEPDSSKWESEVVWPIL